MEETRQTQHERLLTLKQVCIHRRRMLSEKGGAKERWLMRSATTLNAGYLNSVEAMQSESNEISYNLSLINLVWHVIIQNLEVPVVITFRQAISLHRVSLFLSKDCWLSKSHSQDGRYQMKVVSIDARLFVCLLVFRMCCVLFKCNILRNSTHDDFSEIQVAGGLFSLDFHFSVPTTASNNTFEVNRSP